MSRGHANDPPRSPPYLLGLIFCSVISSSSQLSGLCPDTLGNCPRDGRAFFPSPTIKLETLAAIRNFRVLTPNEMDHLAALPFNLYRRLLLASDSRSENGRMKEIAFVPVVFAALFVAKFLLGEPLLELAALFVESRRCLCESDGLRKRRSF